MSWKDILKRVDIDLDEADKGCCEVARGELKQWFEKHFSEEHYRPAEWEADIEEDNCDELLERINDNVREIKNVMSQVVGEDESGSAEHWTPILEELEMIRDNWEDCKEGALKVKDDLKVKPEGFNPEEPYGKHHPYPPAWSK